MVGVSIGSLRSCLCVLACGEIARTHNAAYFSHLREWTAADGTWLFIKSASLDSDQRGRKAVFSASHRPSAKFSSVTEYAQIFGAHDAVA